MKTIKDIITRKNKYTSHMDCDKSQVVIGKVMSKSNLSTRNTLDRYYSKEYDVYIEKYEVEVCGYSMIRKYRRLENGLRPYLHTFYIYTKDGVRSRDFRSLDKLKQELKKRTSDVEKGTVSLSEVQSQL